MPRGGREAITKNLVLREDQLPQKFLHPRTKKKSSKPVSLFRVFYLKLKSVTLIERNLKGNYVVCFQGDEYFISDDVFMNHHSDRKASLQPPVRKAMAVFSQKRNPNDNHYSRSMH